MSKHKSTNLFWFICAIFFSGVFSHHLMNEKSSKVARVNLKQGTVLPAEKKYSYSPMLVDYIVKDSMRVALFPDVSKPFLPSGELDRSFRFFFPGDSNLNLTFKLIDNQRLPRVFLYDDTNQLVSRGQEILEDDNLKRRFKITKPGVYRLNIKSPFDIIKNVFADIKISNSKMSLGDYISSRIKQIDIQIEEPQLARLNEIRLKRRRMWKRQIQGVRWQVRESSRERVVVRVRVNSGKWSIATLGLSGRNTAHASDEILPSLDLKIISGELLLGLKRLKLYVLSSKGNARNFLHESILADHGMLMPRSDIIPVSLNGNKPQYMEMLEGVDNHLFEYSQREEGAILGYDVDALIAKSHDNRFREKNYYKKVDYDFENPISSYQFAKQACSLANYFAIAYSLSFSANHGIGQADLRYHQNLRKGCFDPMVRDLDSGIEAISLDGDQAFPTTLRALGIFAANWRPQVVTHSSYYVNRTESNQELSSFYWWNAHPATLHLSSTPDGLAKVGNFLNYLDTSLVREQILRRAKNLERISKIIDSRYNSKLAASLNLEPQVMAQDIFKTAGVVFELPDSLTEGVSYIEHFIRETTAVKLSREVLLQLAWRNNSLSRIKNLGPPLNITTIPENTVNFLYREENADNAKYIYVARNLGQKGGEFWLESDSGEIYKAKSDQITGSEKYALTNEDLLSSTYYPNEKIRVFFFEIPKSKSYQNLRARVNRPLQYYGVHEISLSPKDAKEASTADYALLDNFFEADGKRLKIKHPQAVIDKAILIPEGYTLVVDHKAELKFSSNGCMKIEGGFEIAQEGSLSLSGSGWQGLHFHSTPDLKIRGLSISGIGRSSRYVHCAGRRYTGGVSFYDLRAEIEDIKILNSHVEDALHFLRSEAVLKNLEIKGALGDAIDADFSSISISDSDLSGSDGDALDISGSLLYLYSSKLHSNYDKNLSVGENSRVYIWGSTFMDAKFGLAVKDSSFVEIEKSEIRNHNFGIAQYVKKPFFVMPEVKLGEGVSFIDNLEDQKEISFLNSMKLYPQ